MTNSSLYAARSAGFATLGFAAKLEGRKQGRFSTEETMSTIGSDYSAHRRSLDELEKEYELQQKKAKERERTRESKLERNVADVVKKKDQQLDSAVRDVKDRYQSAMKDQSKTDLMEREKLKRDLYDRSGRQSAAIADAATTDRDRAIEAANSAEKHYEKTISNAEEYYEKRSEEHAEETAKKIDALAESYRKQVEDAHTDDDGSHTNEYKEKIRKESDEAVARAREDLMLERRMTKGLVDQYETVMKDRAKKSDDLMKTRLREKDIRVQSQLQKTADAERVSRSTELQPLRDQLLETADMKRQMQADKNRARAETIQEFESEWNSKYANQSLSHELEKQKLRSDTEGAERHYSDRLNSFIREKNSLMANTIARQNADHRDQIITTSKEYDRSLDHVKLQAARDKEGSENLLARERALAEERQAKALDRQSATYQTTIQRQRQAQQGQIQNLERVLNNKNTTADAGEISAAAEASVRNAVSNHYEKTFKAEAERNAKGREHLRNSYETKLGDTRDALQSNAAGINRQAALEQHILKDTFNQHIADVEENKRQMLNLANDSNTKMSEDMLRNHERSSTDLKRHYETLMAERDLNNSVRLQEVKNEAEFSQRTMRREHQASTAEMVRNYEKKLTEQKVSADEALRDMKGKLDSQARDSDRRLKQALADQARSYDHRIAETEAQTKDRERLLARNHEDELDKVRKANALLLSKKG
jgi:hypothetical protein